ncbi:MAG: protein kinase [Deltaproteobacteria bacterium]|nr:protein kinase [Deltaproteobacteria bacterium]
MADVNEVSRIGKYEVERRLAFGGMAEVFVARLAGADGFSKRVVIKRILPQFAQDPRFVEMFRFEASLTSRLQHGNIAQVFELGEDDGQLFLVLEYIEGASLRELLTRLGDRGEKLSIAEAAFIADQVARALDYAHRKRSDDGQPLCVVHRDVSPSNILISRDGEVKLTDFGVARARENSEGSRTGTVKGKAEYLAPETILHGIVDPRTDLFGLGAVLWEMLASRVAFAAESGVRAMFNVLNLEVEPPSLLNPLVPQALDDLVLKLLSKDPSQRHARGAETARALESFQQTVVPPAELLADTLVRVELARLSIEPPPPRGSSGVRPVGASSAPQRAPVALVVDESPTFRAVVKAKLGANARVIGAGTLDEARESIAREAPTVVLCQRFVRGQPGLDLCRELRTTPPAERVDFVLIASDVTDELRTEAEALGARAVISKSAGPETLLALLRVRG